MRITGFAAALAATAMLAGCASDSGSDGGHLPLAEAQAAYDADLFRIGSLAGVTAAADVPTEGSALYEGHARLLLATPTQTNLYGEARIEADFDEATFAGQVDRFVGRVDGGPETEFAGRFALTDGVISPASAPQLTSQLDGLLLGGGHLVAVDGAASGSFRSLDGQPADGVALLTGGATRFTLDGDTVSGTLAIVAER